MVLGSSFSENSKGNGNADLRVGHWTPLVIDGVGLEPIAVAQTGSFLSRMPADRFLVGPTYTPTVRQGRPLRLVAVDSGEPKFNDPIVLHEWWQTTLRMFCATMISGLRSIQDEPPHKKRSSADGQSSAPGH